MRPKDAVLKINVFDINSSDTHQLEWSVSDSQLVDLDLDNDINTFELDLASIAAGRYVVSAAAKPMQRELLSSESSVLFTVLAQTVALDATAIAMAMASLMMRKACQTLIMMVYQTSSTAQQSVTRFHWA